MSANRTYLAGLRLEADLTQSQVARAVGLSIASYRRLERGENDNPPLRWLVNCRIFFSRDVRDLLELDWLEWKTLDRSSRGRTTAPELKTALGDPD